MQTIRDTINKHMAENLKGAGTVIATVIVLGVALLGDIMYLQLMKNAFPGGIIFIFVVVGACASFLSMAYLLIGKHSFFHPGPQMWAAWGLVVLDLVITGLNIIDVFFHGVSGILQFWDFLAPVTPLFIMAGVLVVHFLSPEHKRRHDEMIYDDKMRDMERDFTLLQKQVDLDVKRKALMMIRDMAAQDLHNPDQLAKLEGISSGFVAEAMSNLSGYILPNRVNMTQFMVAGPEPQKVLTPASNSASASIPNVVQLADGRKVGLADLLHAFEMLDQGRVEDVQNTDALPIVPETPQPAKKKLPKNA